MDADGDVNVGFGEGGKKGERRCSEGKNSSGFFHLSSVVSHVLSRWMSNKIPLRYHCFFFFFSPSSSHGPSAPLLPPNIINSTQKNPPRLIDILLTLALVIGNEVVLRMFAQPLGHFGEFLAETADGLGVHVCLGDEFGEGDCCWMMLGE